MPRGCPRTRSGSDLASLVDVPRLDPDWRVHTLALRGIARQPPNEDVATRLQDLWDHDDADDREEIAMAWAAPDVLAHGGRAALVAVVTQEHGPGAVEAAAIVARMFPDEVELGPPAAVALLEAVRAGTARERQHAIAAIRVEGRGADDAITALARRPTTRRTPRCASRRCRGLLFVKSKLGVSPLAKLEEIAKLEGDPLAQRARFALAAAKDPRVHAMLVKDLDAKDATDRPGRRERARDARRPRGRRPGCSRTPTRRCAPGSPARSSPPPAECWNPRGAQPQGWSRARTSSTNRGPCGSPSLPSR